MAPEGFNRFILKLHKNEQNYVKVDCKYRYKRQISFSDIRRSMNAMDPATSGRDFCLK